MTVAEILAEHSIRGEAGQTYAGGMTAGDIEDIKSDSAALRARIRAKLDGTQASSGQD